MADIETIGLALQTDGVERGIRSLDELAARGPKVEKSMKGIEAAAAGAGKGVSSLGAANAKGLDDVARAGERAAKGLASTGQAARSAISSQQALAAAVSQFTSAERSYIQSLVDEYKQLSMNKGERAAYIAQSRGMSSAAQEVAKAVGIKIEAYKREQEEIEKASRATKDASDSMLAFGKTALAAVAGGVAFRSFVQAADAVTTLNNQLKLATGSAAAAEAAYGSLYNIAQRSRVGFTELGTTYASIARATGDMGISQQRMLKVTESIANAMTITGGSAQSMQAALVQLSQGMASGVLRGEELNSVMEQAPRLAKALADGLGVPIGKLREMGAAGEITSMQVVKALESQSSVLGKEVAGATLTVGQAFTQLSNASTNAIAQFDKASGTSSALAGALSSVATAMDTMGTAFKNNEAAVSTVMGAIAGGAALTTLSAIPRAFTAVSASVSALGVVLAANPAVLALLGVGAVVGGGVAAARAYAKTESGIKGAIESLKAENERSEAALQRALDGGRTAGADNIRSRIEERKKAIRELNAELALMSSSGIDTSAEDARLGRHTEAMKEQQRQAEELAGIKQKLSGVDKDYLPTLNKLFKQYQDGNLTLAEYQGLVGKLAANNYKPEKQAAGVKAEQSAYESLVASIKTKIAQNEQEMAFAGRLTESDKLRIKLMAELDAGAKTLTASHKASALALLDKLGAQEREMALTKSAVAAYREQQQIQDEIAADYVKQSQAREVGRQAVDAYARGIDESNEALKYEISLMGLSERAREIALEQYRIELDLKKKIAEVNKNEGYNQPERDAEIARLTAAATIAKANASSRVFLQEWKDSVKQYDDIFRQGFADMLNRGEDGWKSFTKSLATTFKTTVADTLYKAFAQPFVIRIVGQLMGLTGGVGGSALQAASGGAGGMLNGLANSGGGLTNWGTWGTGGADWLWNTGADAINRGWTTLGGNMMDLGRTVGQVDTWLRDIPGFGGGIGSAAGYLGAIYSLGQGKPGSAIGQAIGTYIMPGIGTFIGGMLGGFLDGLDDSGTPHIGGSAAWSSSQGLRTNLDFLDDQEGLPGYNPRDNIDNQFGSGMPWVQDNEQVRGTLGVMAQTIASTLDSFAKAFGQQAGYDVALGFADDSSKDGSWGALRVALGDRELLNWNDDRESKWAPRIFSDGEQGWKEFTAATAQDMRDVMTDMDIPGWVRESLEDLGDSFDLDALGAVVTQIGAVNTAFDALSFGVAAFADLTDEARGRLIQESGGLQGFAASASNYYDKFYTDDEKQAFKEDALSKELERLGLEMPKTREEFRAMVEAQLALGESGAEAAAQLMGLSNAAYDVLPAAEEAADSIRTFADAAKESFGITADTVKGLLDDILENAGSAGEARQMGADGFEDMMMSAMMDSLVGSIAGIVMQQIVTPMVTGAAMQASLQTMGAAVSASTLAAGGAAAGAANAAGGGAAAQVLVEGGIGAANAMISGGEAVGQTVSAVVEAARAHMQQWRDIMRDPGFREMLEEGRDIFGDLAADLFDFKGSIGGGLSSVGGSFGGAASAAEGLEASLKGLTSAIEDEIKRLRGIMEEASPNKGYDALMADFATTTAAARAGDEDALGKLPGLSKEIEALLPNRATSSSELAQMRGWLAGSLSETLKGIADVKAAKAAAAEEERRRRARLSVDGAAWIRAGRPDSWNAAILEEFLLGELNNKKTSNVGYGLIPGLATGTNYVPEDMLAVIHKGEAVVPKEYNPAAGGQQIVVPQTFAQPFMGGESEIVAELRELRHEVTQLREQDEAIALEAQRLRLRQARTQERTEGLIAMQEEKAGA